MRRAAAAGSMVMAAALAGCRDAPTTAGDGTPAGFTAATTIGDPKFRATPARWAEVEDASAPADGRVLRLVETKNREEIFNVLLRDEPAPADLALEVRLRADRGVDDRGGGLIWRAQDAANYYLCRWNPLEKNLRAYRVAAGKRVQLQSVVIDCDPAAWHTLAVTMKGRVIEIAFDGRKAISCADPNYSDAGRIGLWTKGDAASSFCGLTVAPAR